jgi:hypothetical protein
MKELALNWSVENSAAYWAEVILFGLLIRLFLAALSGWRFAHQIGLLRIRTFFRETWRKFCGFYDPSGDTQKIDYWYNFILGLFELAAYPILIALEAWPVIGAWISLKTIAQWSVWTSDRTVFNLFLIGNLLVLAVAYFFLRHFVVILPNA